MRPRPSGLPFPYRGEDLTRRDALGRRHESTTFSGDFSGERSYSFNTLGFRGAEFDGTKPWRIFVFGCSHTFGDGLDEDELWHWRLASLLGRRRGIDPGDVCLMNFGESGASNDYIARTLIEQCERVTPHLVLVNFSAADRTEAFIAGQPVKVGPWYAQRRAVRARRRLMPRKLVAVLDEAVRRARSWLPFSDGATGAALALRNVLSVQFYCRSRGIPWLASFNEPLRHAVEIACRSSEVIADLRALCDPRCVAPFSIEEFRSADEPAADGIHPGPSAHQAFAERLEAFAQESGLELLS